ncbi:hypothetical protein Dimus_035465 [Dionaea muscipula]
MSVVPVWVKFDWIPIQMMTKECIELLASQLGTPIMTDKAYARALIEIDVAKELVTERDYSTRREILCPICGAPVDKQVCRKVAQKVSPVKSSVDVSMGSLQPDRQVDMEACPSSMVAARVVVPIQKGCVASSPAKRNQIRVRNGLRFLATSWKGKDRRNFTEVLSSHPTPGGPAYDLWTPTTTRTSLKTQQNPIVRSNKSTCINGVIQTGPKV